VRLTIFVPALRGGGAERTVALLAGEWARRGHQVAVVTMEAPRPDDYLLPAPVSRVVIGGFGDSPSRAAAIAANVRRARALAQHLRAFRPDALVTFLDTANIVGLVGARLARVPIVMTLRNDPRMYQLRAPWGRLRRLALPRAHVVVSQTAAVTQWVRALAPRVNALTIPNAAHVPGPSSDASDAAIPFSKRKHVVAAGTITRQKGFDILIEAFARIARYHHDWDLVILGSGRRDEVDALDRLIRERKLEDRVILAGRRTHVAADFRRCDIFVLSSRWEGFPNVLLEAMACGLPAVAFNCPSGPKEIVRHGVDGFLVPPEDAGHLAEGLAALMRDDGKRAQMAGRAADVLERFSIEKTMQQWDEAIAMALSTAGRAS